MNDYDDILGGTLSASPPKPQSQSNFDDILGGSLTNNQDNYSDVLGKVKEPSVKNPTTFDWMDFGKKTLSQVPAIQAAKFVGEITAREEAAVAEPLLDVMSGKNPLPGMLPVLTQGAVGIGAKKPTASELRDNEYIQLGDIFRKLGWSEPAAATAGFAASLALPSNFLLEGLGAAKIPVKRLFDVGEDIALNAIARQQLIDNAMTVGASQELFKSKVLRTFEKELAPDTYRAFKEKVLTAPDNTSARSIATEYNDWLTQTHLVKAKATTNPVKRVGDKLERVYIDSLPVIKASDVLDGYKGYKGYTATMGKDLGKAETAGIYSGHILKAALGDALEAKGVKTLAMDADTEFRLTVNSLKEQGADQAVEQLLKSKGLREVPKLLPEERTILDTVIAHFNKRVNILKDVFKAKTGYDMGQIPNYAFALKYQDEVTPTITEAINQTMRKPKFSTTAFLKERVENLRVPRADFWNLVNETIANQEWFIHVMPETIKSKQKLASPEFAKALGTNAEKAATYWKDVLLAVENKGQLANSTPYSEFLRTARGNITKATLAFKLSSTLGQFGTIFDALAFALPEWGVGATREIAAELAKVFVIPGYRKAIIKGSKGLTVRQGGELALDELLHEGGLSALSKLGMKPLQEADLSVAAGIESAVKKILKKRGFDPSKINDEADMFMNLINGSSEVSYRPLLLSRGEGAKTMMTFQTFFMYHWSTMIHDLINRGLIRGDAQKKLMAGIGLGLLGAGDVAQDQARKYLYEAVTGSEIKRKDTPFLQDMMWSYFVNVPFFGQLADALMRGRSPEPPLIRQFENAVVGTRQLFTGKTPETKIKGGMKVAEAGLSTLAPIPGTGQLFDFAQRLVPKTPKKPVASPQQKLRKQILRGG